MVQVQPKFIPILAKTPWYIADNLHNMFKEAGVSAQARAPWEPNGKSDSPASDWPREESVLPGGDQPRLSKAQWPEIFSWSHQAVGDGLVYKCAGRGVELSCLLILIFGSLGSGG